MLWQRRTGEAKPNGPAHRARKVDHHHHADWGALFVSSGPALTWQAFVSWEELRAYPEHYINKAHEHWDFNQWPNGTGKGLC